MSNRRNDVALLKWQRQYLKDVYRDSIDGMKRAVGMKTSPVDKKRPIMFRKRVIIDLEFEFEDLYLTQQFHNALLRGVTSWHAKDPNWYNTFRNRGEGPYYSIEIKGLPDPAKNEPGRNVYDHSFGEIL